MSKTTFTGMVNGKNFTSRKEMEKYISECIKNNEPLTSISYKTETRFYDEPEITSKSLNKMAISFDEYLNSLKHDVGEDVIKHATPFVDENMFPQDKEIREEVIEAWHDNLTLKIDWLEKYIFQEIKHFRDDEYADICGFLDDLATSIAKKEQWCQTRLRSLKDLLRMTDEIYDPYHLNCNLIQVEKIKGLIKIYQDVEGYCSAMQDIISDNKKAL